MLSLTGRTVTQYSNSTRTWTRTERALAQHRRTSHKRIYRAVHRLAVPRCSRVRYTLRAFFTRNSMQLIFTDVPYPGEIVGPEEVLGRYECYAIVERHQGKGGHVHHAPI